MKNHYRIAISLMFGSLSGIISWLYQVTYHREAGDFTWALQAAQDVLDGSSPYVRELPFGIVAYPLPAAIVAIPFLFLSNFNNEVAAGLFMGLSTTILAWGLLRHGEIWRLLVFVSFPYWQAIQVVNWAPLLFSIMFLPTLIPLVIVKPQIGLPIFLSRFSWNGFFTSAAFGVLSILILPDWPWQWFQDLGGYAGRPAILVVPFGPLLLLSVWHWRDSRVRYFLYCSLVPLRPFYDYILLWFLPTTYRQAIYLTILSWFVFYGWFFFSHIGGAAEWIVLGMYLPIVGMLMVRRNRTTLSG